MDRIEKTVFISYRHRHIPWALAIYQYLTFRGYDVFIDYKSIGPGDFEQVITENIKARAHFLIILAPSALEGCERQNDWLRREIEIAMENKRNIVPIMLEGFNFDSSESRKYLTGLLENLQRYNGLPVPSYYFDDGMARLCSQYLNVSLSVVTQPVSAAIDKIVEEQQQAAEAEDKVDEGKLEAREWFERGYKSNDQSEQIRYYSKAIELDQKFVNAYNNRGVAYDSLGQNEWAIEDYDKAIELDPEYTAAYYNRGIAYDNLGQYERAIHDFDKAIKLEPKYTAAYYNRGSTYDNLGQHERAIQDYDKAIELEPRVAAAYNNRGITYGKLGQHERAIQDFDKAIELEPEKAATYYNKSCCFALQGNETESITWLRYAFYKNAKEYSELAKRDSNFDGIREAPAFQELMHEFCGE